MKKPSRGHLIWMIQETIQPKTKLLSEKAVLILPGICAVCYIVIAKKTSMDATSKCAEVILTVPTRLIFSSYYVMAGSP